MVKQQEQQIIKVVSWFQNVNKCMIYSKLLSLLCLNCFEFPPRKKCTMKTTTEQNLHCENIFQQPQVLSRNVNFPHFLPEGSLGKNGSEKNRN